MNRAEFEGACIKENEVKKYCGNISFLLPWEIINRFAIKISKNNYIIYYIIFMNLYLGDEFSLLFSISLLYPRQIYKRN